MAIIAQAATTTPTIVAAPPVVRIHRALVIRGRVPPRDVEVLGSGSEPMTSGGLRGTDGLGLRDCRSGSAERSVRRTTSSQVRTPDRATSTRLARPASARKTASASSQIRVARVSNPRATSAACGSSFIVDSSTRPAPAASPGSIRGSSTVANRRSRPAPSSAPTRPAGEDRPPPPGRSAATGRRGAPRKRTPAS